MSANKASYSMVVTASPLTARKLMWCVPYRKPDEERRSATWFPKSLAKQAVNLTHCTDSHNTSWQFPIPPALTGLIMTGMTSY